MQYLVFVLAALAGFFAVLFREAHREMRYWQREADRYRDMWDDAVGLSDGGENTRTWRKRVGGSKK